MIRCKHVGVAALAAMAFAALPASSLAHSVAQVQTAKRIAESTVVLLDPQGNPGGAAVGTDTRAQVGDILTFVLQFTPLPNNATRGAGGYLTEFVPPNTEVVGARFIDRDGNTVKPHRGPQMDDGWGPRGRNNDFDGMGLEQGSLAQLYADTGIFFSTDARTLRDPAGTFITVQNGIVITPVPTGAGQLDNFLQFTGPPFYAHDQWDFLQAIAYGANGGSVVDNGTGNTPYLYGSPVAGPQTHYLYEKVEAPACSNGMDDDAEGGSDYPTDPGCASALDDDETDAADGPVGPWQRIKYWGSEIGVGSATDCESCSGGYVRVGVPTDLGWELSADNPLPAGTNAVRFAVGELVVGEEYFAEISLRVTDLPLDPNMDADVNCAEVFGGDAAMPQNGQDNSWRYFVPSPACVQLNLVFDLSVDKLIALQGDTLTYTLHGKNLSTNPQTNVVISDTFVAGDVQFNATLQGPAPVVGNGTLTWPAMDLDPGEEYTFEWDMTVTGNALSTLNKATYVSDELPDPGFSVVALTDIRALVVLDHTAEVTTSPASDPAATSADSVVHYTVTITNSGTGDATVDAGSFLTATLPAGFSICNTDPCVLPTINGVDNDYDAQSGDAYTWTGGLPVVASDGGTLTLEFDVLVGAGVSPGLYTIDFQSQFDDNGVNRNVENATFGLAPLLVDIEQSDIPELDEPLVAGATTVTGTTSEGAGAEVTVFVNGNAVATVSAGTGGGFTATVPTLYAGQRVTATATGSGEIESPRLSPEVVVQGLGGITACNDGDDNDGDGLTDFPDDPGCDDAFDPDETDQPQCSDGEDNDSDGDTDFPDDLSCSSYLDDDESGAPECSDGEDNDGDGDTDFPDDVDCADEEGRSETALPACANGEDDDDDGEVDYPRDNGCSSASDDDEEPGATDPDAGPSDGGASSGGNGSTTPDAGPRGDPPDLGGVTRPAASSQEGGCGCRVPTRTGGAELPVLLAAAAALGLRWRRRTRQL